ncbi:hypothetical protein TNCV_2720831 [Trichonephila clavipes]|nr:hypothetical protein TNCV_2720831 [Trichonephila clavipes]
MACDAKDWGFQMLNDDEIEISVQEESDSVDDKTDEDEDNNSNESIKVSLNSVSCVRDSYGVVRTTIRMLSYSTTAVQENQRLSSEKSKVYNGTAKNKLLFSAIKCPVSYTAWITFGYPNNRSSERCPVPIDSDK